MNIDMNKQRIIDNLNKLEQECLLLLERIPVYREGILRVNTEEEGLLLRLPVAIGSDVYFIPSKVNYKLNVLHHHEKLNRVYHQKIARIHFTENGWYAEGNLNIEYGVVDSLFVDKLYKETWFLTKEEAERKLVEMKGGGSDDL